MFLKSKSKRKKGYTLIEILITISIIGILSGIIIVAIQSSRILARDKRRMSDFSAYQVALQEYYSSNKNFPYPEPIGEQTDEEACLAACDAGDGTAYDTENNLCNCDADGFLKGYLEEGEKEYLSPLPKDPTNQGLFSYMYTVKMNGKDYKLWVPLERDQNAMANDGGTCPHIEEARESCPEAIETAGLGGVYEVFSTLGSLLVMNYPYLPGINTLSCSIETLTSPSATCPEQKTMVLKFSGNATNAHAGLPKNKQHYTKAVCCSGVAGLMQDDNCTSSITTTFLWLTGEFNAHVRSIEAGADAAYPEKACISRSGSTPFSCRTVNGDCSAGEECICSVSGNANAHIGTCEGSVGVYPNKVCCRITE